MPWSETYSYGTSQGKVVLNAISLKMEPEFSLIPKYVLTDPALNYCEIKSYKDCIEFLVKLDNNIVAGEWIDFLIFVRYFTKIKDG